MKGRRYTMSRKINPQEHWITSKEATAILCRNSGRDDIPDSYIRSLARSGKVASRALDGRTNVYRLSDVEAYKVERRDKGKGTGKKTTQLQDKAAQTGDDKSEGDAA